MVLVTGGQRPFILEFLDSNFWNSAFEMNFSAKRCVKTKSFASLESGYIVSTKPTF